MEQMSEQDRQNNSDARARRKCIAEKVGRVLVLATGIFWLLIFIAISSTGYISWTGIAVGTSVIVPFVLRSVAGMVGKKRLEKLLSRLSQIALLLIAVTAAVVLFWPEDKGTWRPYRFEDELAAVEAGRAVPDHDNAASRYESALAAIDVNSRPDWVSNGSSEHDEFINRPWKAADHPQVSQWLDSCAATIDELSQIGKMEKCRWPVYATADCNWTVPYERLSCAVRLLAMAGNRDLGEGRVQKALTAYFCMLRLADHLCQQTVDIDFSYAFAAERASLSMIRHVLVCCELTSEDIEQIGNRLPTSANTWNRDTARLQEFNKLRFALLMAQAYEINEQGNIRFAASNWCLRNATQGGSFAEGRGWRLYWLMNMPRNPQAVWAMTEKESTAFARFLESGPVLSRAEEDKDTGWTFIDFAKIFGNLARFCAREDCFGTFTYMHFGERYANQMTLRRGTWLVLGLRRYRDANGAWPQTLDLVSKHVPAEAFSDAITGEAFVYAPDGNSFRLYSKGFNRIDDGGRCRYIRALNTIEDDVTLWPPPPPESHDEESMRKELEEIYGKDYVETHFKDDGSDRE
jgi:hypothetical protein